MATDPGTIVQLVRTAAFPTIFLISIINDYRLKYAIIPNITCSVA